LALLVLLLLDLVSRDASLTAQIFLFLPMLYAASQLPPTGAVVTTVAAAACDAVDNLLLQPLLLALTFIMYVWAGLAVCAWLLARAAARQQQATAELQRLAATDPLTGLVTRRVLDSAARTVLLDGQGRGTGLVLVDIDHFKSINDSHGHLVGDEVLAQVAGILLNNSRHGDVVCRMGGDEIGLLLPGCTLAVAAGRAEAICRVLAEHPFAVGADRPLRITVSMGVAHAPTHGADLRSLYTYADEALYAAKRAGRNQVSGADHDQRLSA
jgi:diguanylate cyclase (GGDEF)-like protein